MPRLRQFGLAAGAALLGGLVGCATAPRPPSAGPESWLDRIVPPGGRITFTGPQARVALLRDAGRATLRVTPALWPLPRLEMACDLPGGPPLAGRPRWSQLEYTSLAGGRPYRIVTWFPATGPDSPPATQPDRGRVEYFLLDRPPDRPHVLDFGGEVTAWQSPLHLLLATLGPLPQGRTVLPAVVCRGVRYDATITAAGRRRELRFGRSLLWSDWKDEQLKLECVFIVEPIDAWPHVTMTLTNFVPGMGRLTVRYASSR